MTSAARAFVHCNWWNGYAIRSVSEPSCDLVVSISSTGQVTPGGNMADYNGQ